MKIRLRHWTYGAFVAVILIPFALLALAAGAYEPVDRFCARIRRWAYQEQYAPRARRPGQWD